MEHALTTLPAFAELQPGLRKPALYAWYFAVLWLLASIFLFVVLPLCITALAVAVL